MKQSYYPDAKHVIYLGVNKLKENETWTGHGLAFDKGYVYKVTPEVAEYVKVLRGFMLVRGVKEGIVRFKQ